MHVLLSYFRHGFLSSLGEIDPVSMHRHTFAFQLCYLGHLGGNFAVYCLDSAANQTFGFFSVHFPALISQLQMLSRYDADQKVESVPSVQGTRMNLTSIIQDCS